MCFGFVYCLSRLETNLGLKNVIPSQYSFQPRVLRAIVFTDFACVLLKKIKCRQNEETLPCSLNVVMSLYFMNIRYENVIKIIHYLLYYNYYTKNAIYMHLQLIIKYN